MQSRICASAWGGRRDHAHAHPEALGGTPPPRIPVGVEIVCDYQRCMEHLQSLVPVSLVTTGRTGSDLLQSLLDSHPEVLTFNGILRFYVDFAPVSLCMASEAFEGSDVFDEFVGHYIHRFKSRYDYVERKDRLGGNRRQTLVLDTDSFRRHALGLISGHELSKRNVLLAIYGAYNLCLSHDLLATRILFHHAHQFDELDLFLQDFPDTSVLVTTRDPRATFVSGIENWRRFSQDHDNERHLYVYIKRILEDSEPCALRSVRYAAVRLEDLLREDTMRAIADWLGVSFRPSMLESTWGGLHWYGDRLSDDSLKPVGWTPDRTNNNWRERLGPMDRYVLNYLMYHRLNRYQYPNRPLRWWDALILPVLLFLPLSYERRFLSPGYLLGALRQRHLHATLTRLASPWFYVRRIALFFGYYLRTTRGRSFDGPWIGSPNLPSATQTSDRHSPPRESPSLPR